MGALTRGQMLTHFPTVTQSIGFQPNPQPRVQLMVTQSIGFQPKPQLSPPAHQRPERSHTSSATSHQPPVISHQSSVTSHHSSLITHQPPVTSHQPSIINHQSSAINHQSSVINNHSPSIHPKTLRVSKQGHALGTVPGRSLCPTILAFGNSL